MSDLIKQNVSRILRELPDGVKLVAAAKTRQPLEVLAAVEAGVEIIGQNYVQEAERAYQVVGSRAKWHFIGRLQKNKVKRAVALFDMIETVDDLMVARQIDRRCAQIGKTIPVLIEINSGCERQKSGIFPEEAERLIREVSTLKNIRVKGLMTMGPYSIIAEDLRPYFAITRQIFDKVKNLNLPDVEMRYLSMGMSTSYRVALEECANIVRIGSSIFGERNQRTTSEA